MNTKCYIIVDTGVQINAMYFNFLLDIPSLLKSFKKEGLIGYRGGLKYRLKKIPGRFFSKDLWCFGQLLKYLPWPFPFSSHLFLNLKALWNRDCAFGGALP